MTDNLWQFWIDVGGTFTDCIARRPAGILLRKKVLSSGVTKGRTASGSDSQRIVDPARRMDPRDFWVGYRVRLLDDAGIVLAENRVATVHRTTATLILAEPFPFSPPAGTAYELVSDEEAPLLAIRFLLELPLAEPIPPIHVRLGTTRGTNALLTRRGAKTAFVTTRGFADVLRIGYQNRPRLFDLSIVKPEPLYETVVEIDERLTPDGHVLTMPDAATIRQQLLTLKMQGIESLAICLLNAYCQPQHELLIEGLAHEVGFTEVSVSHRVAPLMKIVSRGDTTVLDAYLNPVLRDYVEKLQAALSDNQLGAGTSSLRLLTSAGGLVRAENFTGKDSILSGPAGGVVGFSRVAQAAGFSRAIGFDMGGTSTDVSRFDGQFETEYETEKAGVRVVAPMLAIETVAAGGGSICRFDGVKLVVGPASAGADPGPACYGRGGPLTVTDVNLLLGKIRTDQFPFPLQRSIVESRLKEIIEQLVAAGSTRLTPMQLADGFSRIANANMAKAIRSISVAKGYDPREYLLVAFGGAAPQHACAVATELGITRVLSHPDAGLLSAYGIGAADVVRHRVHGVYQPLSQPALQGLRPVLLSLENELRTELAGEGIAESQIEIRLSFDLRYQGVDAFLSIRKASDDAEADVESLAIRYEQEHQRLYGYAHHGRAIELVAVRIEAIGRTAEPLTASHQVAEYQPDPNSWTIVHFDARPQETMVFRRSELAPGAILLGPAIITEPFATTVIEPEWMAEMLSGGELLITRREENEVAADSSQSSTSPNQKIPNHQIKLSSPDPVLLEIFNNHFAGIAEQMGITLRNTSSSVNVKERLDFSCAIFTKTGDLVVNAPHIPVHLGAMSETVKCVLTDNPDLCPGDVFVTNDPYRGGSHLPDITVVTPVHDPTNEQLIFFTASRAHHAEIGGITPGSVPPFSKTLAEEGVLIRNFKIVDRGESRTEDLRELLLTGPYPSRNADLNLADIAAQIAANHHGQRDLLRLIETHGWPLVDEYMHHIQNAAEQKMRTALAKLPPGRREFVDHLDDGSPIAVAITIDGDSATIDFTGTGPVLASNLNANPAIVTAAVMYVMRCLIAEDIPLNQGVLAPVQIILPHCLLNPVPAEQRPFQISNFKSQISAAGDHNTLPAIVGGNVETSQRVVDVLLGALGLAAASQGTMNNLLFGDNTFGYYETICGGSGATAQADGADAVHTHMTNTRLTDPEVLERRFPVRVREFSIRRGSGGAGHHHGGDGVIRCLEFLQPMEVSILSQRRGPYAPYGLLGGQPGSLGRNILRRANSSLDEPLPNACQLHLEPGDSITIETPGGGGFG